MPHTTAYIKPHALEALTGGGIVASDDDLPVLLARQVADVFKDRVGEDLEVGKQSLYYPYIITHSMPADLAVVVVAWWTPDRAPHWDEIRDDLEFCIGWYPNLHTESHLVVIGDPRFRPSQRKSTRRYTDAYDLGQGTPGP